MRGLLVVSAGLALVGGGAADAQQRPGASYGVPGAAMQAPMKNPRRPGPIAANLPVVHVPTRQAGPHRQPRWGDKVGGRWSGGANAPGSLAGYRRPYRGFAVPGYWNAPRFYVGDWATYHLPQPPQGYNWARYYDDAVLIDARGSVFDTQSDIDWDRADAGGYAAIGPRDSAPLPPYRRDDRPPGSYTVAPGGSWVSPDGMTTVTTSSGVAYPAGSTTVIVQSVPVTTTTTTTTSYYETSAPRRRTARRRR
ncbi:MAG TPA: RcnB family protein [Sphingomonas sp.]|nr:RcnB family protein [Sphingomonas sp.]